MERNPIQELPEDVICKIAAGEVVERPVSIVKELVENSIDAGSTEIEIEVVEGGRNYIKVSDNGCGIPQDEIKLALTRHATSKIRDAHDIYFVDSLGFRGEALPSIAAVSSFTLITATQTTEPLAYMYSEGNILESSRKKGTSIEIKDLFEKIPARLKFLKSPATEWAHIYDYVCAMALYYEKIQFKLIHNNRVQLFAPHAKNSLERVKSVLGLEIANHLYSFEEQNEALSMKGFLSHPNFSRESSKNIFVFINGRYIADRVVNHAIVKGYDSLLMKHQYPFVILEIVMDPQQVDINVHPAKKEVRFSQSQLMHNLISGAISKRLSEAPWVEKTEILVSHEDYKTKIKAAAEESLIKLETKEAWPKYPFNSSQNTSSQTSEKSASKWQAPSYSPRDYEKPVQEELLHHAQPGRSSFADLKFLGQIFDTYILCQDSDKLCFIDQHAAHERIGFEKLKIEYKSGALSSQRLLTPISFELSPSKTELLKKICDLFIPYGFELDYFGDHTFMIKAIPSLLSQEDPVLLIKNLMQENEKAGRMDYLEEKVDHVLATLACHTMIRANQSLAELEIERLLKDLTNCPRTYHCPHGRPVLIELEKSEIEKWFKRVL